MCRSVIDRHLCVCLSLSLSLLFFLSSSLPITLSLSFISSGLFYFIFYYSDASSFWFWPKKYKFFIFIMLLLMLLEKRKKTPHHWHNTPVQTNTSISNVEMFCEIKIFLSYGRRMWYQVGVYQRKILNLKSVSFEGNFCTSVPLIPTMATRENPTRFNCFPMKILPKFLLIIPM